MRTTSIARLSGALVSAAVAVGALGALAAASSDTPAPVETIDAAQGDVWPTRIAPPTTAAVPTTTTTAAPVTTTTAPPPPPTVPPTTTPPTTAAPVTAPPVAAPAPPVTAPPPPPPAPAPVAVSAPSMNSCESDTMRWMNEARAANGSAALTADGAIAGIARSWASQLLGLGNLLHNPDYASQVFGARPQATTVAENVGRSSGSVRGVFDRFMQSSGHRASILNPAFSHAAAGCSVDALGQHWVVVNFWG